MPAAWGSGAGGKGGGDADVDGDGDNDTELAAAAAHAALLPTASGLEAPLARYDARYAVRASPLLRVAYRVDTWLSSWGGKVWGLFLAASLILILGTTLKVLSRELDGQTLPSLGEIMWVAWAEIADPGAHLKETAWVARGTALATTFLGILFFALIVGVVVDGIRQRVEDLRKGRTTVLEAGHYLLLGWTDKSFPLIQELCLALDSEGGGVIVVLSTIDKTQLEGELREHFSKSDLLGTKIVVRCGSPMLSSELSKVSASAARAIVVLAPPGPAERSDSEVVRTVLAVRGMRQALQGHVVAEMRDVDDEGLVEIIGRGDVETVVSHDIIGRLMINCARQPGLADVYEMFLGFEGDEWYIKAWPQLVGSRFGDLFTRFPAAVPVGVTVAAQHGAVLLNPPDAYVIAPGDEVLVLAEDDDAYAPITADEAASFAVEHSPPPTYEDPPQRATNTLMCGWRRDMDDVIEMLDSLSEPGSTLHILSRVSVIERRERMAGNGLYEEDLENVTIVHYVGNPAFRRDLETLPVESYDSVLLFADEAYEDDALHSDSQSLACLLLLRHLQEQRGVPITRAASREWDDCGAKEVGTDGAGTAIGGVGDGSDSGGIGSDVDGVTSGDENQHRGGRGAKPRRRKSLHAVTARRASTGHAGGDSDRRRISRAVSPEGVSRPSSTVATASDSDGPLGAAGRATLKSPPHAFVVADFAAAAATAAAQVEAECMEREKRQARRDAELASSCRSSSPRRAGADARTVTAGTVHLTNRRGSLGAVPRTSQGGLRRGSASSAASHGNHERDGSATNHTRGPEHGHSLGARAKDRRRSLGSLSHGSGGHGNVDSGVGHHGTDVTNLRGSSMTNRRHMRELGHRDAATAALHAGAGHSRPHEVSEHDVRGRAIRPAAAAPGGRISVEAQHDHAATSHQARNAVVCCELLDARTRHVIVGGGTISALAGLADYILSNNIIARVLAMVGERREVKAVFNHLLGPDGNEVRLVPALKYVSPNEALSFWEVLARVRQDGSILLGYKRPASVDDVAIVLNPTHKHERLVWLPGDELITMAVPQRTASSSISYMSDTGTDANAAANGNRGPGVVVSGPGVHGASLPPPGITVSGMETMALPSTLAGTMPQGKGAVISQHGHHDDTQLQGARERLAAGLPIAAVAARHCDGDPGGDDMSVGPPKAAASTSTHVTGALTHGSGAAAVATVSPAPVVLTPDTHHRAANGASLARTLSVGAGAMHTGLSQSTLSLSAMSVGMASAGSLSLHRTADHGEPSPVTQAVHVAAARRHRLQRSASLGGTSPLDGQSPKARTPMPFVLAGGSVADGPQVTQLSPGSAGIHSVGSGGSAPGRKPSKRTARTMARQMSQRATGALAAGAAATADVPGSGVGASGHGVAPTTDEASSGGSPAGSPGQLEGGVAHTPVPADRSATGTGTGTGPGAAAGSSGHARAARAGFLARLAPVEIPPSGPPLAASTISPASGSLSPTHVALGAAGRRVISPKAGAGTSKRTARLMRKASRDMLAVHRASQGSSGAGSGSGTAAIAAGAGTTHVGDALARTGSMPAVTMAPHEAPSDALVSDMARFSSSMPSVAVVASPTIPVDSTGTSTTDTSERSQAGV